MEIQLISNTRIESSQLLLTPKDIKTKLPITEVEAAVVLHGRRQIEDMCNNKANEPQNSNKANTNYRS